MAADRDVKRKEIYMNSHRMHNRADLLQAGRAQLAAFRERVNTAKATVFVKMDIGNAKTIRHRQCHWRAALFLA